MSDKKELDDEIGKELEDRLDDEQSIIDEDDYTVKVHREDYTVRRRFFDKGKALEAADSLRQDKDNIVEDNIEHDFVTLIDEEDDVDWDKLVDKGLEFYPPISDAAQKKLDDSSVVAEELAAAKAMLGNDLDKTLTMEPEKSLSLPKIEKDKPDKTEPVEKDTEEAGENITDEMPEPEAEAEPEIEDDAATETEAEADNEDTEPDEEDYDADDSDDSEEEFESVEYNEENGGFSSSKKMLGVLLVVLICAGLFFLFGGSGKDDNPTEAISKPVKAVKKETPLPKPVKTVKKEAVTEKNAIKENEEKPPEPEAALFEPAPEEPKPQKMIIPEVTHFHQYSIHLSSYRSQAKAVSETIRIRKKGYNAYYAFIRIPGKGGWYRVYIGYYDDYKTATAEAKALKKKFREDATVAKTIYAVQIGDNGAKKDLAGLEKKMNLQGYTPYWLPVNDTEFVRLIAGAYRKQKDADALSAALKSKGYEAKTVKR